jgi:hypothetical protein
MRTYLRGKITLLFMTFGLLLAIPAIALADNVKNDVVAGGNDTIVTGGSTTINYEIQQTGSGGLGGCDATTASPVTVNINAPAGVTASKSSLKFTSCGAPQSVAFSSNTAGNYPITVSTVDNVGDYNTSPAAFTLHVTDPPPPANEPPTLSLPSNQTAEATSAAGAVVSYTASATDAEDDPDPTPNCSPASGSTFPLGSTTVNCSVTDSGGLSASGFFTVTVQDTTAPTLNLPANQTEEATGPNGAAVSFNATANDIVDGSITPNCDAASGDTFQLGTTTVHCTATDAHGNSTSGSFTVTVRDTTAPTLNLPNNITKQAPNNSEAVGTYSASASDLVDGSVAVTCTPASGSTFHAGTTTVNCSATDNAGNTRNGSFTVTVNYGWTGFFRPVDNPDTVNSVKAGQSIPVKFSLAGNQGLNIFAAGSPTSQKITCDTSDPVDAIEETVTAGGSSLSYDSSLDQYNYVWKTDKSWAGTCRQLTVKTADGTTHVAIFKFLK